MRRLIANFFGFSRAQTNAFLVFLPMVTIWIFSAPVYRWWLSQRSDDFSTERTHLDSLALRWSFEERNKVFDEEDIPLVLFPFNPNDAEESDFLALGFSKSLSKRILNYRTAGGKFIIKPDLLKLYGMDSAFYDRLEPYISLPVRTEQKQEDTRIKKAETSRAYDVVKFNLNHADTILLKSVYGIGSKISQRIVNYREALGGFIQEEQLYEVYGLDSVVVQKLLAVCFIESDFYPRALFINTATEEQLSIHPYISKRMAKAIVTYRFQHGKYHSIADLSKIIQMDENRLAKLKPYLSFD